MYSNDEIKYLNQDNNMDMTDIQQNISDIVTNELGYLRESPKENISIEGLQFKLARMEYKIGNISEKEYISIEKDFFQYDNSISNCSLEAWLDYTKREHATMPKPTPIYSSTLN